MGFPPYKIRIIYYPVSKFVLIQTDKFSKPDSDQRQPSLDPESHALAWRRGSDGTELVKKNLAAAARAPPHLVAEGEKNVPLAPSLSKPSVVFLHCTPSSAVAGAQCRSAAVARVAPGDGPHVGENVVRPL